MGIDVSKDKEVTFNGEHERRVVTSTEKKPKCLSLGPTPNCLSSAFINEPNLAIQIETVIL